MSVAVKFLFFIPLVAGALSPAFAADVPIDNVRAIRATGDGTFFIGDCTGKAVVLAGDRQSITLLGTCKSVVSHGSGKRITLDGTTTLRVFGDGNTVKWKTRPESVTAVGHRNVLGAS